MKLLVVAPYFYPKVGGLENYAWNISKGLKEKYGWVIVVVTSNHEEKKYKKETIEGIKIYRLPYWFKLSNTPINFGWFIDIWKIMKKEKPDVVNGHSPVPFIADVANQVSLLYNVPYVLTYHAGSMKKNSNLDWIIGFYESTVLKILINNSNKVVCFYTDFINKYLTDKTKMIKVPPGVDTEIFQYSNKKRENSVVYVGKIDSTASWKGLRVLIEAIRNLSLKNIDIKLNIVGEGNSVAQYKDIVKDYQLGEKITFTGKLEGVNLVKVMQNAKALVLPSTSQAESFGIVLIEAMACGTPVIGSNIGGIPRVIEDSKNGYLFKPGSSVELAKILEKLLRNDKVVTNLGAFGYKKVKMNFTWEMCINKYFVLFDEISK